jgi:hypothetical protein
VTTPRRLRPAPWGVLLRQGEGKKEEEDDEETVQKVDSSVLRVAAAARASASAASAADSCFPRTVVRCSRIAGLGLYALGRISRGSAVAEYSGELLRAPLADMREVGYARLGLGESPPTPPHPPTHIFSHHFFGVEVEIDGN